VDITLFRHFSHQVVLVVKIYSYNVHLLHLRILCFPQSRISDLGILHLETRYIRYLIWCLGFSLYIMFLVWCLESHLCVLSICILIRSGYIREHVENLKLSWIKIQNERRWLVAWDQGLTSRLERMCEGVCNLSPPLPVVIVSPAPALGNHSVEGTKNHVGKLRVFEMQAWFSYGSNLKNRESNNRLAQTLRHRWKEDWNIKVIQNSRQLKMTFVKWLWDYVDIFHSSHQLMVVKSRLIIEVSPFNVQSV